jgi:hypothetical protein
MSGAVAARGRGGRNEKRTHMAYRVVDAAGRIIELDDDDPARRMDGS